jgi:hypothetical protein
MLISQAGPAVRCVVLCLQSSVKYTLHFLQYYARMNSDTC